MPRYWKGLKDSTEKALKKAGSLRVCLSRFVGSLSHFPLLPVSRGSFLMGSHTDCACPTSGNSKNLRRFARDLAGSFLWVVFCVKLQNCTDAKQTVTVMPFNSLTRNLKTEQFCYSSGITGSPRESSLLPLSIFVKVNSAGEIYYEFYTVWYICKNFNYQSSTPAWLIAKGKNSYSAKTQQNITWT